MAESLSGKTDSKRARKTVFWPLYVVLAWCFLVLATAQISYGGLFSFYVVLVLMAPLMATLAAAGLIMSLPRDDKSGKKSPLDFTGVVLYSALLFCLIFLCLIFYAAFDGL